MRWLFREATTSFSLLALSPPHHQNPTWHCMRRPMRPLTCSNVLGKKSKEMIVAAAARKEMHSGWSGSVGLVVVIGPFRLYARDRHGPLGPRLQISHCLPSSLPRTPIFLAFPFRRRTQCLAVSYASVATCAVVRAPRGIF